MVTTIGFAQAYVFAIQRKYLNVLI